MRDGMSNNFDGCSHISVKRIRGRKSIGEDHFDEEILEEVFLLVMEQATRKSKCFVSKISNYSKLKLDISFELKLEEFEILEPKFELLTPLKFQV